MGKAGPIDCHRAAHWGAVGEVRDEAEAADEGPKKVLPASISPCCLDPDPDLIRIKRPRAPASHHRARAQLQRARSVSVVEIRKLIPPSTRPVTSARFVLLADGTMIIVGRTPEATQAVEELTAQGVPGPGGTYIKMDAGMEFLRLLAENFRGSRLWATTVFEMEEDKALEISPTDA